MNINMKTIKLKFLHRALVLVNAYNCAKFQLPSSISYGDMEGSKNNKKFSCRREALRCFVFVCGQLMLNFK